MIAAASEIVADVPVNWYIREPLSQEMTSDAPAQDSRCLGRFRR
jgi:hypothetical protein